MAQYPKFKKAIQEGIVNPALTQVPGPTYGIVLTYDTKTNTAHVLSADPNSDLMGEIFADVPCPVNLGVQSVAPQRGRPCWLMFKRGTESKPYITHFLNFDYEKFDYNKMNYAQNELPQFLSMM